MLALASLLSVSPLGFSAAPTPDDYNGGFPPNCTEEIRARLVTLTCTARYCNCRCVTKSTPLDNYSTCNPQVSGLIPFPIPHWCVFTTPIPSASRTGNWSRGKNCKPIDSLQLEDDL